MDLQGKRVGVGELHLCTWSPSRLNEVVEEVVHEDFRQVENRDSNVARFVELHLVQSHQYSDEVLVVNRVLLVVRFQDFPQRFLPFVHQPYVNVVHHVLASLSEHRVVSELPKVFLEAVPRLLPLLYVLLDVGLHPGSLIESQRSVNLGDLATEFLTYSVFGRRFGASLLLPT